MKHNLTEQPGSTENENQWTLIQPTDHVSKTEGHLIIPLSLWLQDRDDYAGRTDIAIWLDSHEEPESIAADLPHFRFIALNFPTYRDGRAYSSATILRGRLGYQGKLHAIGDIRPDQLEEMIRCGFDVFQRQDGSTINVQGITRFSYHYQSSADQSLPLFRIEKLATSADPDQDTAPE